MFYIIWFSKQKIEQLETVVYLYVIIWLFLPIYGNGAMN